MSSTIHRCEFVAVVDDEYWYWPWINKKERVKISFCRLSVLYVPNQCHQQLSKHRLAATADSAIVWMWNMKMCLGGGLPNNTQPGALTWSGIFIVADIHCVGRLICWLRRHRDDFYFKHKYRTVISKNWEEKTFKTTKNETERRECMHVRDGCIRNTITTTMTAKNNN